MANQGFIQPPSPKMEQFDEELETENDIEDCRNYVAKSMATVLDDMEELREENLKLRQENDSLKKEFTDEITKMKSLIPDLSELEKRNEMYLKRKFDEIERQQHKTAKEMRTKMIGMFNDFVHGGLARVGLLDVPEIGNFLASTPLPHDSDIGQVSQGGSFLASVNSMCGIPNNSSLTEGVLLQNPDSHIFTEGRLAEENPLGKKDHQSATGGKQPEEKRNPSGPGLIVKKSSTVGNQVEENSNPSGSGLIAKKSSTVTSAQVFGPIKKSSTVTSSQVFGPSKKKSIITVMEQLPTDLQAQLAPHAKNASMSTNSPINNVQRAYVKMVIEQWKGKKTNPNIAHEIIMGGIKNQIFTGNEQFEDKSLYKYLLQRVAYEKKIRRKSMESLTAQFRKK